MMASRWVVLSALFASVVITAAKLEGEFAYTWTRNVSGILVQQFANTDNNTQTVIFTSEDILLFDAGLYGSSVLYAFSDNSGLMAVKVPNSARVCYVMDTGNLTYDLLVSELEEINGTIMTQDTIVDLDASNGDNLRFRDAVAIRSAFPAVRNHCARLPLLKPAKGTGVPGGDDILIRTLIIDSVLEIQRQTFLGGPPAGSNTPPDGDQSAIGEDSNAGDNNDGFFRLLGSMGEQPIPTATNQLGDGFESPVSIQNQTTAIGRTIFNLLASIFNSNDDNSTANANQ